MRPGTVSRGLLLAAGALATALHPGCGLTTSLNRFNTSLQDAIDSFDRAIAALAQQSADWRIVVQDLEKNVTADLQSTIRTEVTNLTRVAILTGGAELRCNAEFMRVSLERQLTKLRNDLAREIQPDARLLPEPVPHPFICDAVPAAVDLSVVPERRMKIDFYGFDLRSQPITVSVMSYGALVVTGALDLATFKREILTLREAARGGATLRAGRIESRLFTLDHPERRIRTDVSNALSILSDFHAVLDLTESGFSVLPNAQSIVLSWDDRIQSEIAILTDQKVLKCEIVSRSIPPGGTVVKQTFIPPAVTTNIYGEVPDKEFNGNGPCIRFDLSLLLDPERKKIRAQYHLDAWESTGDCGTIHSDYTEAEGTDSIELFAADDNEKILGFDVDASMTDSAYQSGGDTSVIPIKKFFGGTKPVTELQYVGDTDGDEAGSKTGVTMFFRPFHARVEHCELQ